ncbi:hypothetical protein ABZV22_43510, partial [Streptosporangium canum]
MGENTGATSYHLRHLERHGFLKRSPRVNPGDSSHPNRAALRTVATLLLGGSPSGPVYP